MAMFLFIIFAFISCIFGVEKNSDWIDGNLKLSKDFSSMPFKIGDRLVCEIVKNVAEHKSIKVINTRLTPEMEYTYIPAPIENNCFSFKVRAANNVYISLSSKPQITEPMIEVILGIWNNKKSAIRKNYSNYSKLIETEDILSDTEFRGFWINWENGVVMVGHEWIPIPTIQYKEPEKFPIKFLGIRTTGGLGTWILEEPFKCAAKSTRERESVNFDTKCRKSEELVLNIDARIEH